jgi:cell division protein FtsB
VRWSGGHAVTILLLLAIAAVAYSAVLGQGGLAHLRALRAERQRLGQEAVALIQQNDTLRDEIKRLTTDDRFLESYARRELDLVRPGEIVFRFHRPARPPAAP